MQCAEHPKVETYLRCGKCDKPICPLCMVQTPVGARCKACARLKTLPIFEISPSQYALAIGVGVFLALIVGVAWAFIGIPFLSFWIPLGVGYLVGEVISQVMNRKRSRGLQVIVGASVFATYLFSKMIPYIAEGLTNPAFPLDAMLLLEVGVFVVTRTFAQPFLLLSLGLGLFIGITRIR